MEVAEGIHRLTRGIVNFYLVGEGGKFVLIDAGTPSDWTLLVGTLAEFGATLDDLEAVVLTHAHSDHTGFAERARTAAGARVWVHDEDAAVARGARPPRNDGKVAAYLLRPRFYRTVFSLVRRGASRVVPIAKVSSYADGETLDVPGRPLVVRAPGHTPGSCALLLEGRRVLLTGDTLITWNPLTGRVGPQVSPSGFNRDTQEALRSLDVLEPIPGDFLLPGHGEPWAGGCAEAVRLARAAGPS